MKIQHWEEWTPICEVCGVFGRDSDPKVIVTSLDISDNKGKSICKKLAKIHGWVQINGHTFCPKCKVK